MQTNGYGYELVKAQAGQKADIRHDYVDSYLAEVAIPFGKAVVQGTASSQCKLPVSAEDKILGVSVFTHTCPDDEGYKAKDAVSVMSLGRIYGHIHGAFTKEANIYVLVAGDATNGEFTANSGATNCGVIGRAKASGADEIAPIDVVMLLRGQDGADGTDGTDGADAPQIIIDEGAPDNAEGNNGDYYINSLDGTLYNKVTGAWVDTGMNLTVA